MLAKLIEKKSTEFSCVKFKKTKQKKRIKMLDNKDEDEKKKEYQKHRKLNTNAK